MPTPRERSDLPYMSHLEPLDGAPARDGDYDTISVDNREFDDVDAGSARFMESVFSSVTFIGGSSRRARFIDVWLHTVRWVGTNLGETNWLDAEVVAGSLAGLEMFSAELHRVTFFNCKFDSVSLRAASLRDVTFVDCLLRDVDFGAATLNNVAVPGSTLEGVRLETAKLTKVDLRGAASLGITAGHEALRGATISPDQLVELAPAFAGVLGVRVEAR